MFQRNAELNLIESHASFPFLEKQNSKSTWTMIILGNKKQETEQVRVLQVRSQTKLHLGKGGAVEFGCRPGSSATTVLLFCSIYVFHWSFCSCCTRSDSI